ncbi:MAG: hypothetical protein PSX36_13195, partial [bacterium]|nr:hypothetical protein [bacterium]
CSSLLSFGPAGAKTTRQQDSRKQDGMFYTTYISTPILFTPSFRGRLKKNKGGGRRICHFDLNINKHNIAL